MNEHKIEESETERKKFEDEYLLSKKPIEYMERLKRKIDKERFRQLQDKEKGFKGNGGGR